MASLDDEFFETFVDDLDLDSVLPLEVDDSLSSLEVGQKTGSRPLRFDNAERCRRHRRKRKEEEMKVHSENKALKEERENLLQKISDLELEEQSLGGAEVIDLQKENELLKLEIKKHRSYISRVMEVIRETPLETQKEETLRLLKNSSESGAGQIIGLCYASAGESDSWTSIPPFTAYLREHEITIHCKFQFLPRGATAETACRLNIRCDYLDLPVSKERLFQSFWHICTDMELHREKTRKIPLLDSYDVKQVYPLTRFGEKEELICVSVATEKNGKRRQTVQSAATKETKIYNMAFNTGTKKQRPGKCLVTVVNSSTCPRKGEKMPNTIDTPKEVVPELWLSGTIFKDNGNGTSHIVNINSWPQNSGIFDKEEDGHQFITADGQLTKMYKDCLVKVLGNFAECLD